jgi:phytoene dehydrogenase-like protein
VIGAGLGGLSAALRLARAGWRVDLVEGRTGPGGLASGLEAEGFRYDGGPYVLLDRPGLAWAFAQLGLSLDGLDLLHIEDVYEVSWASGPSFRMYASLDATADWLEAAWAGSGRAYRGLVARTARARRHLDPLLRVSRPRGLALIRTGAWRGLPYALRTLDGVLRASGLPPDVQEALAIWTHVAGQRVREAPSALAMVPALIHEQGAWYPRSGIAAIAETVARAATSAGVRMRYGTRVKTVLVQGGAADGVETDSGERLSASVVVSGAAGLATSLDMIAATPPAARARLSRWPLQSPGVCAYLACRGPVTGPYLRFRLGGGRCRLFIRPVVLGPAIAADAWWPARLMAPMPHAEAQAVGRPGQEAYLEGLLAEEWWRGELAEVRVVERRVPAGWGTEFGLFRDSMNPVMTARLMRGGRLPHRNPYVRNLYLAGSATHPGQWMSFCAISGVLAADCVTSDLG